MSAFWKNLRKKSEPQKKQKDTPAEKQTGWGTWLKGQKIDEHFFDALEDNLIKADVRAGLAVTLVEALRAKKIRDENPHEALRQGLEQSLAKLLKPVNKPFTIGAHRPYIIMVSGVNGSGKTTTIGKLTHHLQQQGYSVGLVAADTFRSGASEQLQIWAERTGAEFFTDSQHQDAAALTYQAIEKTVTAKTPDILIIDTAGRLHNNQSLMEALGKILRVMKKLIPDAPHESLLVLDATTGQNALQQTKHFTQEAAISGIIMTKLDGTAKGGILPSIAEHYQLPIYFLGLGEAIEDLVPFDAEQFIDTLLGDG